MSSVNREIYKLLWPPTEAEYQALLDAMPFNDELAISDGVKADSFTAGATLAHTRPDLEGTTIVGVKVGQAFLAATDYTLVDDVFTLTDNFDSGTPIIVLYK